jgi:NADPH:quinone reductase-like Zn-dependent oxidoreductase
MVDVMDAWILDHSPGSYRRGDIAVPALDPHDVLVRVVASALNHMDLWVTKGLPKPHLPHVPGCDVAGVVEAVGSAVTSCAVGDEVVVNPTVSPVEEIVALGNDSPLGRGMRILGEHRWGGHGEFVAVPDRNVRRRPAGRSWADCAAYPLTYATAYRMLRRARAAAGQQLLVVGVGSGVSCAALAIALHMGCRVAVTSRSPEKRLAALAMGAHEAFDSAAERWPFEADVVVESVGPATWDQSVRSLRPGGRLVVCGGTSGSTVQVNLPRLFFKQIEIIGSTMASYEEFEQVSTMVEHGLPVHVDSTFGFHEYPEALERLAQGDQLGKIVIEHGG